MTMATNSQVYKGSKVVPMCASCNKPVTDTVLSAMGKSWHPEHFTCGGCNKPIKEATFRTQNGQPYCEGCYMKQFGKSCSACGQTITGSVLTALNRTWHEDCFKCTRCQKPIAMKEFTEKNGNPYCMGCGK